MKADLKNKVQKVCVEGKIYCFEYDFNAYSELEDETCTGVYKLYESMVSNEGISLKKSLAILGCAMLKHHSAEEIQKVIQKIKEHPGFWLKVKKYAITAFLLPLLPPEILERTKIKKSLKKKDVNFATFDWIGDYTIARKVLGWSDAEFWASTPRKLFAVYYSYLEFQLQVNNTPLGQQQPLVGKEAIKSLFNIAGKIR